MVLRISPAQMAAFEAQAEARYRLRLIQWLGENRGRVGRPDAGPAECEAAADAALALADRAGVVAEDDIASIASRWLQAHGDLRGGRFAHVERILRDPAIDPAAKLDEIRLTESLAQAARAGLETA